MTHPYVGCVQGPMLPVDQAPFPLGWEGAAFVDICKHEAWEFVLFHTTHGAANEVVVRCSGCHAPRCGHATDADPCMRIRHHGDTVVIRSVAAEVENTLSKREHWPYSEMLYDLAPRSLEREDLEQWLSE